MLFRNTYTIYLILISIFITLNGSVFASENRSSRANVANQSEIDLNPYAFFTYEFTDQTLAELLDSSNDTLWQKPQATTLNVGSNTTVWVKVPLHSVSNTDRKWVLRIDWALLTNIEWYLVSPSSSNTIAEGKIHNWKTASTTIDTNPFVTNITLPAQSNVDLYIRAGGVEKVIVPLALQTPNTYVEVQRKQTLFTGLFYGALLAMIFYNLSLYIFIRDTNYALYCVYILTVCIYTLSITGIGIRFIWGELSWLNYYSYRLPATMSFLMAAIFIRQFLALPKHGGYPLTLSNLAILSWLLMLVAIPFLPSGLFIDLMDGLGYVSCVIGIGISSYRWYKGDPSGKYMTISWCLLIVSTFILMLGITNVIGYDVNLLYFQNIGFLVEALLLSMALAERINRARIERSNAQASALYYEKENRLSQEREYLAQQRTLAIEREAKENLELRVNEQTREIKLAMDALSQANQELQKMSQTDALTSLANRRCFDKKFATALEHAIFKQSPIAIIMVDIDYFKNVNDTYGHQAGDECLRQISTTLQKYAKSESDLCARYGGEEFCLVLPDKNTTEAQSIAEAIRLEIESQKVHYSDKSLSFTVSLGLHVQIPTPNSHPETLLKIADDALYKAKANGRNRTVVF